MSKPKEGKSMSKKAFFQHFADKFSMKRKEAEEIFDEFNQLAYSECKNPKGFVIPGLGKLLLRDRKARMGRNPKTGESIKIPAKKVLKFRISKAAKVAVLGATVKSKKVVKKNKKNKK